MKRFFLFILPFVMTVMFASIQCDKRKDIINCTGPHKTLIITLKYPDDQPVLLDSSKVFWVGNNRYLEQTEIIWELWRNRGIYEIVGDGMRKELQNKKEIMRFSGYLNGEIVCEKDVLVGANYCHIEYLGTELLILIIPYISLE